MVDYDISRQLFIGLGKADERAGVDAGMGYFLTDDTREGNY